MRDVDDITLGIDEAGRGPILGPMVMACVGLSRSTVRALKAAGVADSKAFGSGDRAHERRLALCPLIRSASAYWIVDVIDVAEIDRRARVGELNRLEQERAARMLAHGPPARRIVADGERLFAPLRARYPQLVAVDRGEEHHLAVAAASILAKVRRDELWHKIVRRYQAEYEAELGPGPGLIRGGGYVNDATRRFLRAYCARRRCIPPEGRQSWPWTFASDLLPAGEAWASSGQLDWLSGPAE